MNTTVKDDFAAFIEDCELFNSDVKLYDSVAKSNLVFEGKGIYDKKPNLIQNEDGTIGYSGHKSAVTLARSDLGVVFTDNDNGIKDYYIDITDNSGTRNYIITNDPFSSNVVSLYCELKLA